jgi:hypothetical protein
MSTRLSVLAASLCLVLVAIGCTAVRITGSGQIVTRDEPISDFDRLDISHGFRVSIEQTESFGVVIRVDDNLVSHLQVAKEGRTLRIGLKPRRTYYVGKSTLEATVSMPELTGLELSGGSEATIAGLASTKALAAELSGDSILRGDIQAGDARFTLSGESQCVLSGSAGDLTLEASGDSQADLSGFAVADANLEISGESEVTVNASGRLNVEASGESEVYYVGNPTLGTINATGGSEVNARQ